MSDRRKALIDPWAEEPPAMPSRADVIDLSIPALSRRVGVLSNEIDRASRILARRISAAGAARADYQLEHDRTLLRVRSEGKRTAADERRAMVHEQIDPDLFMAAEVAQAQVESARAYVRGLEAQLSAVQSQLKTQTALLAIDDGARAAAAPPLRSVA